MGVVSGAHFFVKDVANCMTISMIIIKSGGFIMKYWEEKDGILKIGYEFEEGGWYIETDYISNCAFHSFIKLYEIPPYGGKPELIGDFFSLSSAFKRAGELT